MAYHNWSEKDFDWKGLNEAGHYIADNLVRWGRVSVRDVKEKWGGLRLYMDYGWWSIHSLTHPRYAYIQYKRDGLLWKINYLSSVSRIFKLLNYIVVPYHRFLYRYFYGRAVKKWPHLREEILDAADFPEDLKGL